VVHTREAAEDTLELLALHADGRPVIIHCFSLSDHVEECVERGYYCSFAGNVTYPKARELQRAAAAVPDDLLLVETDAPFLSPQARRGKPNEPAFVTRTAEFVAELRGTTYEALERTVGANAARLFGW
jgi:TatD DNase family protein